MEYQLIELSQFVCYCASAGLGIFGMMRAGDNAPVRRVIFGSALASIIFNAAIAYFVYLLISGIVGLFLVIMGSAVIISLFAALIILPFAALFKWIFK